MLWTLRPSCWMSVNWCCYCVKSNRNSPRLIWCILHGRIASYGEEYDDCFVVCVRHTIRYNTIEEFNMDSKAESVQLDLAHVARKNIKKEESKTNKWQCPLRYRFKISEDSPEKAHVHLQVFRDFFSHWYMFHQSKNSGNWLRFVKVFNEYWVACFYLIHSVYHSSIKQLFVVLNVDTINIACSTSIRYIAQCCRVFSLVL